jgi:hypothetical protein
MSEIDSILDEPSRFRQNGERACRLHLSAAREDRDVTGNEIELLFYRRLPRDFVKRALRAVYVAHRVARDDCYSRFAPTEARNVLGYNRRALLEGYLRDVADLFPDALESRVVQTSGGWNHTEIWGGPVALTENSVQTPCGLVDKADFRRGLAESNQDRLWDEPVPKDAPLFALLLHSRYRSLDPDESRRYGYLPGSVYIAFPARDLESYLHAVNLFVEFPEIVEEHMPQEWNHDARLRYVRQARRMAT